MNISFFFSKTMSVLSTYRYVSRILLKNGPNFLDAWPFNVTVAAQLSV